MIDIGLAIVLLGFCVLGLGVAVIVGAEMVATAVRVHHRRSGQHPPHPLPGLPPGSDERRRKVVGKAADIVRHSMRGKL